MRSMGQGSSLARRKIAAAGDVETTRVVGTKLVSVMIDAIDAREGSIYVL